MTGLTEQDFADLEGWWASDWPRDESDVLDSLRFVVDRIAAARVAALHADMRAKIEALADDPWTVSGGYAEGRPSMMVARRGAVGRGLFVKVDDLRALLADLGGEPQ